MGTTIHHTERDRCDERANLGIVSVVYGVNLLYLLIPPYFVLFVLTLLNNEKYVNIAWDGGAVTTGPVTVPLKISIVIAQSHATGFAEGFGILALASAYLMQSFTCQCMGWPIRLMFRPLQPC
jgi:hypothetical protein